MNFTPFEMLASLECASSAAVKLEFNKLNDTAH